MIGIMSALLLLTTLHTSAGPIEITNMDKILGKQTHSFDFTGLSFHGAAARAMRMGQNNLAKYMQHDANNQEDNSEPQTALKDALNSISPSTRKKMFRYLLQNPTVDFRFLNSLAVNQAAGMVDLQLVKDLGECQ